MLVKSEKIEEKITAIKKNINREFIV